MKTHAKRNVSPSAIRHKAAELGKLVVRMTSRAASGHPSSALSLAHIVTYLMYRQMRWDPADPWHPTADRLVLSEGHAVPIVYAALADLGATIGRDRGTATALTTQDLDGLRARASVLDGHPNPAVGMPFFDAATGSLGQGLSVAAGLAAAARLDGSGRRIYVIVGDGESREGQVWEALDFIVDHALSNVCAIFNANGQGQAGPVSQQQSPARLVAKLKAFGWLAVEVDGHDPTALAAAFKKLDRATKPLAIVARTIKGWGAAALQNGNWHGKPLAQKDLEAAYASLADSAAEDGGEVDLRPPVPEATPRPQRPEPHNVTWPSFAEAMEAAGIKALLERGILGTRRAYGAALLAGGRLLPHVVALDADVSNSTMSDLFAAAHPRRFFECKIAEQNMISAAVGLAAAGYIPFVNSFAKFIARGYDQIELATISRANIKIVGSHAGVTPAADGPSQMALNDVTYFRSFTTVRADDRRTPVCWLYHPADALAAYHCTRLMIEHRGLCYMRTHRPDVPLLYSPDTRFEPGGFNVLVGGADLALVGSGYMVHVAREVAGLLAQQNIRAGVIDAYSLPIVDGERLMEVLRRCGGLALVVEDNYGGGFGAAVAEIAALHGGVRVATLSCDRIPKSNRAPEETLEYCGVSAGQIADHALALLRRPR